jgi:hypothetical protein
MQGYLLGTVLVFHFGPWDWPLRDASRLVALQVVYQAALLAGGWLAARAPDRPLARDEHPLAERLLVVSCVATLVLFLPTVTWLTAGAGNALLALRDPGAAYYAFQDLAAQDRPTTVVSMVRFALGGLLALPLATLAVSWHRVGWGLRAAGAAAALSGALVFALTGRNKGFADLALVLPWAVALAFVRRPAGRVAPFVVRTALVAAAFTALFVASFVRNNAARQGVQESALRVALLDGIEADPDHPLVRHAPPTLAVVALALSFNQTHGYLALAMAQDKRFPDCRGLGTSFIVQRTVERLVPNTQLCPDGYARQLERDDGYSASQFWHTTYLWFANDVGFWGVALVLVGLGWLLAASWRDAATRGDPLAAGVFFVLLTIHLYLPMNNVVLGQPEGLAAFATLVPAWLVRRRG